MFAVFPCTMTWRRRAPAPVKYRQLNPLLLNAPLLHGLCAAETLRERAPSLLRYFLLFYSFLAVALSPCNSSSFKKKESITVIVKSHAILKTHTEPRKKPVLAVEHQLFYSSIKTGHIASAICFFRGRGGGTRKKRMEKGETAFWI